MEIIKSDLHEVTKIGIFDIRVCSLMSEDDALVWVRHACPSGTAGNWQKQQDPNLAPIACANGGGRTHYVFSA